MLKVIRSIEAKICPNSKDNIVSSPSFVYVDYILRNSYGFAAST